jgi:hypothetical protein
LGIYDSITDLLFSVVRPAAWGDGNNQPVASLNGCLVIDQTDDIHEEIASLFAALRAGKQQQRSDKPHVPIRAADKETIDFEERAKTCLDQVVSIHFERKSLAEFVEYLRNETKLNILLDAKSLADVGAEKQSLVSLKLQRVKLRTVLDAVCRQLKLEWSLQHHAVLLTSAEVGATALYTVVYPIGDLEPAPNARSGRIVDDWCGEICEAIEATCKPSWSDIGGAGHVTAFRQGPFLVVSQTRVGHENVVAFLGGLRKASSGLTVKATPSEAKLEIRVYANSTTWMGYSSYETTVQTATETVRVIKNLVEPASWEEEGVSVEIVGNSIVVRHRPSILAKIDPILGGLGYTAGANPRQPQPGSGFFNVR